MLFPAVFQFFGLFFVSVDQWAVNYEKFLFHPFFSVEIPFCDVDWGPNIPRVLWVNL
jgi:hypothetical protein